MSTEREFEATNAALEAVDRELAFFRRRAGQVFFLSLLVEAVILTGQEELAISFRTSWASPFALSVMFAAVAIVGSSLGAEYRARIHKLKKARLGLTRRLTAGNDLYPRTGGLRLSEIQMLYVVLVFLSSAGVVLVWQHAISEGAERSVPFEFVFRACNFLASLGLLWAIQMLLIWHIPWKKVGLADASLVKKSGIVTIGLALLGGLLILLYVAWYQLAA